MSNPDFSALRAAMVSSQLRTNAITEPSLLAALDTVPREDFVPEGRQPLAYIDVAISLGNGRAISAPLATARIIQESGVRANDKVLLIGAGTGYAAALLHAIGAEVYAVEQQSDLLAVAKENLAATPVRLGNGSVSETTGMAPFDVLIIDGAVEEIPHAFLALIAEGGTVASGILEHGITRVATGRVIGKVVALQSVVDLELPVLPGFSNTKPFSF